MKKSDGRKNARVTKGNMFKMEWMYSDYVETFLKDVALSYGFKNIINVCCGNSTFGNIRLDIDPKTNRTKPGNLFGFHDEYGSNSCDCVLVDAPFEYFNPYCMEIAIMYNKGVDGRGRKFGDPYQWQYDALKVPKKLLILRRNLISTNWSGNISKYQEYFLIKDSRPSSSILEFIWK